MGHCVGLAAASVTDFCVVQIVCVTPICIFGLVRYSQVGRGRDDSGKLYYPPEKAVKNSRIPKSRWGDSVGRRRRSSLTLSPPAFGG